LAVEDHVDAALLPLLDDLARWIGVVGSAVPDDAVAGAVLAVGDPALEISVLERVILCLHREPLLCRVVARALRRGPAGEDSIDLEPDVVMEPCRVVLVHHVPQLSAGTGHGPRCRGLRSDAEVSLLPVRLERVWPAGHAVQVTTSRSQVPKTFGSRKARPVSGGDPAALPPAFEVAFVAERTGAGHASAAPAPLRRPDGLPGCTTASGSRSAEGQATCASQAAATKAPVGQR